MFEIFKTVKGAFCLQDLAYFSQVFLKFAERECKGSSALYGHLSKEIAKDEFILELSMKRREGQPAPNLLFGAAHF